jgi:hypothetical protein
MQRLFRALFQSRFLLLSLALLCSNPLKAAETGWEALKSALEALPDNTFYEWKGSAMGNLVTCETYPRVANCHRSKNVFDAWVTGSYIPERREFYILAPGGHNDAPESGSYRFDFNTGQWNLIDLIPETPEIDLVEDGDYVSPRFNSNNKSACKRTGFVQREPVTYHSYDGQLYVPELDGILLFGHYTGTCGDPLLDQDASAFYGRQGVFIFHLASQQYEQVYGLSPKHFWFPTTGILENKDKHLIYVTSKKGKGISFFETKLVRDNEGRLQLVAAGQSQPRVFDGTSIVVKNKIISASRNFHINILTLDEHLQKVIKTQKITYPQGKKEEDGFLSANLWGPNGLAYYPPLNSLFQWRNDGYILQIILDEGLSDSDRFRLARPAGGGTQPGLQGGGIYGKWFWIDELKAFAGYDSNELNWIFYKPPRQHLPQYHQLIKP